MGITANKNNLQVLFSTVFALIMFGLFPTESKSAFSHPTSGYKVLLEDNYMPSEWINNIATSYAEADLPTYNIILGRPTANSITVNVNLDQQGELYFEYGTSSGNYSTGQTAIFNATAGVPVETEINGLEINTQYFYRILFRSVSTDPWIASDEYTFHTQRSSGESFIFTIASDSHFGQYGGQTADEKALYAVTLQNIAQDHPDFHMDLGDTYAMDPSPLGTGMTEAEADAAYYVQIPYLGQVCHSIPYFQALGNHENEEGWNFDDVFPAPDKSLAKVGILARKKYIPNPVPDGFYTGNEDPLPEAIGGDTYREDYYAWEWGDVLLVVLDPYHYSIKWPSEGITYGGEGQDGEAQGDRWDWTLGINQYLWFKATLENSNAKYKFVFSHHETGGNIPYGRGGIISAPFFEWGGKNADGTWGFDTKRPASEGWDLPIHELMVDNGVNVYFHGHDHIFAYEELDGIVYLECPKPDDAGYDWQPYGYGYFEGHYPDAVKIQNSGYIRVSVSPDEARVDYVRAYLPGDGTNGEVAYTFTVQSNGSVTTHDLTISSDPVNGGTTIPSSGTHSYNENTVVNISAEPAQGYVFENWTGNVSDPNQASTSVTMSADQTVTAHFIQQTPGTKSGDMNGDGLMNSTDALIILSCDVGFDVSRFCPTNCGDVNGDGLINSTDALIILSFDVGMLVPFPVGEEGCPQSVTPCAGCVH